MYIPNYFVGLECIEVDVRVREKTLNNFVVFDSEFGSISGGVSNPD